MPPLSGPAPHAGVVIPIRAFHSGKARLAAALDDDARAALARSMAQRVVAATGPLRTVVVSSAPEVEAWASAAGLVVVGDLGTGLDGAVRAGVERLVADGAQRVVVAHADLPRARPESLLGFAHLPDDVVALVPCHRDDGTPVLSVPTHVEFPFAYGPGSARRHAAAAESLGLVVRVVRDPDLAYDVDVPADLADLTLTDPIDVPTRP